MNNNNHHTEEISTERLMVRRGQPFTITVCFSAPIHNYLWLLKRTLLIVQTGNIITIAIRALLLHLKNRAGGKSHVQSWTGVPKFRSEAS